MAAGSAVSFKIIQAVQYLESKSVQAIYEFLIRNFVSAYEIFDSFVMNTTKKREFIAA